MFHEWLEDRNESEERIKDGKPTRTVVFIRIVQTVIISITTIEKWNTSSIAAFEGPRRATRSMRNEKDNFINWVKENSSVWIQYKPASHWGTSSVLLMQVLWSSTLIFMPYGHPQCLTIPWKLLGCATGKQKWVQSPFRAEQGLGSTRKRQMETTPDQRSLTHGSQKWAL